MTTFKRQRHYPPTIRDVRLITIHFCSETFLLLYDINYTNCSYVSVTITQLCYLANFCQHYMSYFIVLKIVLVPVHVHVL